MTKKIEWTSVAVVAIFFTAITLAVGCYYGSKVRKLENLLKEKEGEEVTQPTLQEDDSLDEWTTLQMAIAMTESRFNPKAVGATEDWGIIQITPIYVKECNRILKQEKYAHEDAFDVEKSLEMFEVLQSHYNPQRDLEKAIRYHNKAGWYRKKVLENIIFIQQMEEARKLIKQRG